jgi:hypothetical protein
LNPTVTAIVVVVVGVVLLGIIWALGSIMREAPSDVSAKSGSIPPSEDQLRPVLVDFHVHGDTAEVYYGVPLPDAEIDEHLRDVLLHDASMVLHQKRSHGLPIDQVVRAVVFGSRGGSPVEVGEVELEEPGTIPEIVAPELIPHAAAGGFDPLAHMEELELEVVPGLATRAPDAGLPPFRDDLTLIKSVESKLRAAGVDPDVMTLPEFALTLLRIGGYELVLERRGSSMPDGSSAEMYRARRAGSDVLVVIVPQLPGEHPELAERDVNAFVIEVAQRAPDRALLITDKCGPYIIHEKEKADPRCRFVTRERLQSFADSFALR